MSRIEFENVEQKMKDLRGYCTYTCDPDKNPYRASELTDDEFNFISGFNYALSRVTDIFLENRDVVESLCSDIKVVDEVMAEITKKAIEGFAGFGYSELEQMITAFIEDHEEN